jgi:siroheme synthase-like protein
VTGYLPIALDLHGRRCLVVGGGAVAARKIESLLQAGASEVAVVAPEVRAEIADLATAARVEVAGRGFVPGDLDGVFLVMAATDDPEVNRVVAAAARERGVLVNAADDPAACDFIMPAVVRRGNVAVAVTTEVPAPPSHASCVNGLRPGSRRPWEHY